MERLGLRYLVCIVGTVGFFSNFIACGAKMYKVDVSSDIERTPSRASSSEANSPNHTFGIHSPSGWTTLPIPFTVGSGFDAVQKKALISAMHTWELAVGRRLFDFRGVSAVDGDSFPGLYQSLEDATNGQYLDYDWKKIGKPVSVLATTIWDNDSANGASIRTADIRYNCENYLIGDSLKSVPVDKRELVDMESLALHELGHLLGLTHVEESDDPYSIMNPALFIGEGLVSRRISLADVARIQSIYGCLGDSCNAEKLKSVIENGSSGLQDANKSASH